MIAVFFLAFGIIRYSLPLIAPFLLGWGFARTAEPVTGILHDKLHFPRSVAAGIGVSLVLLGVSGGVCFLAAVGYRELGELTSGFPAWAQMLETRFVVVRDWGLNLADGLPGGLGRVLRQSITGLFAEGSLLLEQMTTWALSAAGSVAGKLPGGALSLGTAVLSAYMIGAQYPTLREKWRKIGAASGKWQALVRNLGQTLGLWLRAQVKLTGLMFAILAVGLGLLRLEHWVIWAAVTAVVDAIPVLGTGTVLLPMAGVCFLSGEQVRAVGLLGLYVTAMLIRSALEPRLVGKQLGMNPLTTLAALYVGFRIWGVAGMILSPILAVTAEGLAQGKD